MNWFLKILFLAAITVFFATSYFLGWLTGAQQIITATNESLWVNLPYEFQIGILGFVIVIILAFLNWIIRR